MKVFIASPLRSYTHEQAEVDASGANLRELLGDLDRRYPGIRFRMVDEQDAIRPHIRVFVNAVQTLRLDTEIAPDAEVHILQALSGG